MKKRSLLFALTSAIIMTGCNEVPEDVKSRAEKAQAVEEVSAPEAGGATLDELNASIDGIRDYIREKGYGRFELLPSVRIDKAEHLYEAEVEVVSDMHRKFPELYEKFFGRDVYADSGVDDLDKLPLIDDRGESEFCRVSGSLLDGYIYSHYYDDNSRSDNLSVSSGGFFNYTKGFDVNSSDGLLKEMHNPNCADFADVEYELIGGGKMRVSEAVRLVEQETADIFGALDSDYTYRVDHVYALQSTDGDAYSLDLSIEKCYQGVSVCDQVLTGFVKGERMQKPAWSNATVSKAGEIETLNTAYGFDRVVSSKEISSGLITLPQAFDILNSKLAPKLELSFCEIKLSYYCDYDASDVYEAEAVDVQARTDKQANAVGYPEMTPGRRCRMFPVWQFVIDRNQKDENGNWKNKVSCDIIMIDARTGEFMDFIDRVARL